MYPLSHTVRLNRISAVLRDHVPVLDARAIAAVNGDGVDNLQNTAANAVRMAAWMIQRTIQHTHLSAVKRPE